jgi:cytochrome b involved in lipid metabolism
MGRGGEKTALTTDKNRKITLDEVSSHRVPQDAWVHMGGKVYDVSSWNDHPGTYALVANLFQCTRR